MDRTGVLENLKWLDDPQILWKIAPIPTGGVVYKTMCHINTRLIRSISEERAAMMMLAIVEQSDSAADHSFVR